MYMYIYIYIYIIYMPENDLCFFGGNLTAGLILMTLHAHRPGMEICKIFEMSHFEGIVIAYMYRGDCRND